MNKFIKKTLVFSTQNYRYYAKSFTNEYILPNGEIETRQFHIVERDNDQCFYQFLLNDGINFRTFPKKVLNFQDHKSAIKAIHNFLKI